jgi:hypothetical protein
MMGTCFQIGATATCAFVSKAQDGNIMMTAQKHGSTNASRHRCKHQKFKRANTSVARLNTKHDGIRKFAVSSWTRTTTKSGANINSQNQKILAELT